MVVAKDKVAVIFASGKNESIVDCVARIYQSGIDEPGVGFQGFVEVVSTTGSVGTTVGELGGRGEVELIFDCANACVCFIPPVSIISYDPKDFRHVI